MAKAISDFEITSNPREELARGGEISVHTSQFVIPKHDARRTSDWSLGQAAVSASRSDTSAKNIIGKLAKVPVQIKNKTGEKNSFAQTVRKLSTTKNTSSGNKNTVSNIKITHPDRVIDAMTGVEKYQLAEFYACLSPWLLSHLHNRPVSLLRAPTGVSGEQFFQKYSEHFAIPFIKQLSPKLDPGHARLMEVDMLSGLIGAVQMGTIEFHTCGATSDNIETPDRMVFDLDPDPALPWHRVVEATRLMLAVLDELKLDAFLKTSGGKGLHIVVPLAPELGWDCVKEFSKALSQFMERQLPERFVTNMEPQNRLGKIFIDYLRNQRGASTIAAFSVRARAGLPVSVPITREELLTLTSSAQWHLGNLHQRLDRLKKDPWVGYKNKQTINSNMWKKLGIKPAK